MPQTKSRFFSQDTVIQTNNDLHKAILEGDKKRCFELIKKAKSSMLNQKSAGNTPLMLALKVGLFDVALVLAEHPDVIDDIMDNKGFSVMHYAAFFRQDNILIALANKQEFYSPLYAKFDELRQLNRYQRKWCRVDHLYRQSPEFYQVFSKMIIDRPGWYCSLPILTNLLFHLDKICINNGIATAEDIGNLRSETLSSGIIFRRIADTYLDKMIEWRNQLPASESAEIVELLETYTLEDDSATIEQESEQVHVLS